MLKGLCQKVINFEGLFFLVFISTSVPSFNKYVEWGEKFIKTEIEVLFVEGN